MEKLNFPLHSHSTTKIEVDWTPIFFLSFQSSTVFKILGNTLPLSPSFIGKRKKRIPKNTCTHRYDSNSHWMGEVATCWRPLSQFLVLSSRRSRWSVSFRPVFFPGELSYPAIVPGIVARIYRKRERWPAASGSSGGFYDSPSCSKTKRKWNKK